MARRSPESGAPSSFEGTLAPDFVTSHDGVKRFNANWQKEMREGRDAVKELIW